MLKTISLVFAFCMTCLVVGCDNTSSTPAPAAEEQGNSLGIKADCIICVDHRIAPTDKTPHVEYKGKQYYFCNEAHLKQFEKDPETALAKYAAAKAPTTAPAAQANH